MGWALGEGTDLALLWLDSQAADGTPGMGTGTPRLGMGTLPRENGTHMLGQGVGGGDNTDPGGDRIPSMGKIGPLGTEFLGGMDPQGGGGTPEDGGSTPRVGTETTMVGMGSPGMVTGRPVVETGTLGWRWNPWIWGQGPPGWGQHIQGRNGDNQVGGTTPGAQIRCPGWGQDPLELGQGPTASRWDPQGW